jgi:hypothetical protein
MEMAREYGGQAAAREFERSSFVGKRWPIEDWIPEVTGMAYRGEPSAAFFVCRQT